MVKQNNKTAWVLAGIFFLMLPNAMAAGTSGATILKYFPGPRNNSLADTGVSITEDFNSSSYNPAALGTVSGYNISALYYSAFSDANVGFLAAGKDIGPGSLAIKGLGYFGGNITINDLYEPELDGKTFTSQQDFVFSVGYGLRIMSQAYAGVNLKYYQSTLIEQYNTQSYVLDTGVIVKSGLFKIGQPRIVTKWYSEGLNIGVAALNIGQEISYTDSGQKDPLPFMLRGGVNYPLRFNPTHAILVTAEAVDVNENDTIKGGAGLEYINNETFFVRAGYKINYDIKHFTWGLGFKYDNYSLDYGMGVNTAIGSEHNVLFSIKFGDSDTRAARSDYMRRSR